MRARVGIGMLAGASLALGFACSSFEAGETITPADGGLEAALEDVATPLDSGTDAGTDGGTDAGSGCPDKVVYVAPSGNDSSTGCTTAAPKLTVGGAIAYVKTLGLTGYEVHVCRGMYTEAFTLDYPVSLRGGYECATWTRLAAFGLTGFSTADGTATGFDLTNESVIIAPSTKTIAVDISGAAITRAVTLEGLTIRGRADTGGVGVRVRDSAAPTFVNDVIVGSQMGALNADYASAGADVADDAAPEFTKCRIYGGKGSGASYGSVGIRLHTSGKVLLHENEISGGDGVGTRTSTIAVLVDPPTALSGENALQNNTILFGGTTTAAGSSAAGVVINSGAKADVWDNRVLGGQHTCGALPCNAFGIFVTGTGSRILRNRVYAGQMTAASTDPSALYAILAFVEASDLRIVNNAIHTGKVVAPSKVNTFGIALGQLGSARLVAYNTIFSPDDQSSIGINSIGPDTRIQNNLLVGVDTGLLTGSCSDKDGLPYALPTLVQNNAFVPAPAAFLSKVSGSACGVLETTTSVKDTEAKLGAMVANGNATLRPACGADNGAQCQACTGAGMCFKDVFGAVPGFPSLIADPPFAPLPNAWCGIVKGGLDLGNDSQLDIAKRPRMAPETIGAVELADKTTCVP